jgi:hypothetical protein
MARQEGTGPRARIPAAVAAATAAALEGAARLLEKASQVVPLRRVKKAESPAPQSGAGHSRDDTH